MKRSARLPAVLLSALLAGLTQTACAQRGTPALAMTEVPGTVAQVRIVDRDSGRALPIYQHQGDYWVAGRPGARYGIAIMGLPHRAEGRIEAVISVDGVNVISGKTASIQQTGYVLSPGQWHTITGWRKNDQQVAAFHFTALPDSYAARTGRPDNVGVIGVALYREKAAPPIARPRFETAPSADAGAATGAAAESRQRAPAPSAGMPAAKSSERLGTGHGPREYSAVSHTSFERRSQQPEQIVTIRYDSHENLVAMGVIPQYAGQPSPRPQPFPHSPSPGYVPDPPN